MIRIFLSHSGADLALAEGALNLLDGLRSEPARKLLRARIELPDDVDNFASRIAALQREGEFFVFVLFSKNWKITNAVRLARRLADARPRSAVLCEKEWGADTRNLEPFSNFSFELINFTPEQISRKIESHLGMLRTQGFFGAAHKSGWVAQNEKQSSEQEDRADAELAGEDCRCPLEAETFIASLGVRVSSSMPPIEDLLSASAETDSNFEMDDPASGMTVDPEIVAAMQRLAEQGYGLEEEDLGFTSGDDPSGKD